MKESADIDFLNSFSEAEMEVATILLELPRLFSESESRSRRPFFNWGAKKKRSPGDASRVSRPTSSSPPPLVSAASVPVAEGPSCEPASDIATDEVADRPSPTTPLSFSPSESEDKCKKSKKKGCVKRKREELSELVEELNRRKELFTRELETVKKYYEEQKVLNLLLKNREEEIMSGKKKKSLSPGRVDDNVGHQSLPDLNVTPAEVICDMNRVLAAQARQRRIQICRSKFRHMNR